MKLVAISDTHGKHHQLQLPEGDTLIHAGDISMKGGEDEVDSFLEWFGQQPFKHKIVIAGNHDFYFERTPEHEILNRIPGNIVYLNDSGITIEGLRIWGSPVSPWFFNWAFNRHRGDPIKRHWELIPGETDILITHGPVFRTLDRNNKGQHVGCKDLFGRVNEIQPQVHICGHIHEAYGTITRSGTRFVNASVVNSQYEMANPPVVFEL